MRAYFAATGLSIVLTAEDKEKDRISCVVNQYKKPRVFLRVVDDVTKSYMFEEPGFHMQCWPPNVGSRESTKIFVYLSKRNWEKLITEYDPEAGGGFFCSRCKYDRLHINYYDMTVKEQSPVEP